MEKMISVSSFFGVALSLAAYMIGLALQKRFKKGIFNPLLISIVLVIGVLLVTGIDYKAYNVSASYLGYLLTPTTICLAIPLYRRLDQLKKNFWAIIGGITSGAVTSMGSVWLLCLAFGLDHSMYATLLRIQFWGESKEGCAHPFLVVSNRGIIKGGRKRNLPPLIWFFAYFLINIRKYGLRNKFHVTKAPSVSIPRLSS